ncbi:hypothetical protein MAQA_13026 [Listeria aquatica FSL S10-1188]|uniref:Uncharacterized protein n=1 Tax=Listeria aquatica FSL S10-1188 TaxID=1265818 RepID=W7AUT4_9LIST|nr:hypothetical protein MAQA_13026 [Listeria aquatica FSL S10-1188]
MEHAELFLKKRMLKYPLYGLIAATIILCVITFFLRLVALHCYFCSWYRADYSDVLL